MTTATRSERRLRAEIAQLAAKLIASEGIPDFLTAKRKAALRLGVRSDRCLPTNREIEHALQEYQRLFQSQSQPGHLHAQRTTALRAMEFLARFRPRLAGAVLHGTATEFSEITLHLYCNVAEEVAWFLDEAGIAFKHTARTIKTGADETREFPALCFTAADMPVVLVLFTEVLEGVRPLSTVDGKPMRRASAATLRSLLDGVEDVARPHD
ncbi:MAG: hypothetical protein HYR49_02605 [Gammaproteobacteria bacterium]|nr:hypothetical protein [Gammaproteobacteria bacterium]